MGHSIAAKYAARAAARFVRPSARARERRLGLGASGSFSPATRRVTELRSGGVFGGRRSVATGSGSGTRRIGSGLRPRHPVRMVWSAPGRQGPARRAGATAALWRA